MSESPGPPGPQPLDPDEVTRLLRAGVRKERPWTLGGILFWLAVLALPLVLLLWWVWPRPAPPRLLVLAFDQIATPGETIALRAQLRPAEGESPQAPLAGREVYFVTATGATTKATSNEDGTAGVDWQAPAGPAVTDLTIRQLGIEDKARIFTWPPETPLLVVSADLTLADAPADAWRKRSTLDIPRRSHTAEALQQPQMGKFHLVYLALRADGPLPYGKVRTWVQLRPHGKTVPLPDGPVLGRPSYAADLDETRARREVLAGLRKRFSGPLVGVTDQAAEAAAFRDAGLRALLVAGPDAGPAGVVGVPSWADLPRWLHHVK